MEQENQEQAQTVQSSNQTETQWMDKDQAVLVKGPVSELTVMLQNNKARKLALRQKQQQSAMKKYIQSVAKEYRRAQRRLSTELQRLESQIGKKDFELLKDICTVRTPEQKNENGEVTQQATSHVNKKALLVEARNLLVLRREERIKKGLRKRTTGRSNRRSAHNAAVRMITQRNKAALEEDVKNT